MGTTIGRNRDAGNVFVYDSIFKKVNGETKSIGNIFQLLPVTNVKVAKAQKQRGTKDCGLFPIANETTLACGQNPSKLGFRQESVQSHFVTCLEQNKLVSIP